MKKLLSIALFAVFMVGCSGSCSCRTETTPTLPVAGQSVGEGEGE
jgi:PBP1b-binding outer membrane lipoprotein LpoB